MTGKRSGRSKKTTLSDEMQHICALIDGEIAQWPDVSARSMFGFRSYYRKGAIFAMLPEARPLETPQSIAYKLASDGVREGKKWRSCETEGPASIRTALGLLEQAYLQAGEK